LALLICEICVGGSYNDYEMDRRIVFGTIDETARSSPEAWEFDSLLGIGYDWRFGSFVAGVFGSLQYVHLAVDSFQESDAGVLNLAVDEDDADSLRHQLGSGSLTNGKFGNGHGHP
jgi:uncharacterized protein with beta-barrel porin domain